MGDVCVYGPPALLHNFMLHCIAASTCRHSIFHCGVGGTLTHLLTLKCGVFSGLTAGKAGR